MNVRLFFQVLSLKTFQSEHDVPRVLLRNWIHLLKLMEGNSYFVEASFSLSSSGIHKCTGRSFSKNSCCFRQTNTAEWRLLLLDKKRVELFIREPFLLLCINNSWVSCQTLSTTETTEYTEVNFCCFHLENNSHVTRKCLWYLLS